MQKNIPTISFTSTSIKACRKGYTVSGQLTIKGVSKIISFPFTRLSKMMECFFTGSFAINRKDFNVGGGSAVLGNNVDVTLKVFAQ